TRAAPCAACSPPVRNTGPTRSASTPSPSSASTTCASTCKAWRPSTALRSWTSNPPSDLAASADRFDTWLSDSARTLNAGGPMRIITIEEHFHHPEVTARVMELVGPGPVVPDEGFGPFLQSWMPDRDSAERLAGERLAHMDRVGIDVQVVSHGAGSPGTLVHAEAVELCQSVND